MRPNNDHALTGTTKDVRPEKTLGKAISSFISQVSRLSYKRMTRTPVHNMFSALTGMGLSAAGVFFLLVLCMDQGIAGAGSRVVSSISLAGSNELWTENWEIQDSRVRSDQGVRAGFHRLLPLNKGIRLAEGARGIVCLFPDSRHKPAKLVNNHVSITSQTRYLAARIAALRTPPGRWEFQLSINREKPFGPVLILGSDGWQELVFDLKRYMNQSVDIEVEVREASSGRDPSAFIDQIELNGGPGEQGTNAPSKRSNEAVVFDQEFIEFLELWRRNEEIRQQRMMDRSYLDYLYDRTRSRNHQD